MKEFRIVIQNGEGREYSLWSFDNFESCYGKLLELILNQSSNVNKPYYVINDFYDNKYPPFLANIKKYKIECREISENWHIYSINDKKEKRKDNILYLFKKEG